MLFSSFTLRFYLFCVWLTITDFNGEQILGFVDECDRRIRAAQRRLEKTPEENNRTTALVSCFLSPFMRTCPTSTQC
jgi:hypothetical protein